MFPETEALSTTISVQSHGLNYGEHPVLPTRVKFVLAVQRRLILACWRKDQGEAVMERRPLGFEGWASSPHCWQKE